MVGEIDRLLIQPMNSPAEQNGMDATVIVCSYARAAPLRDALRALCAQKMPPTRNWEVVVIDNNLKDDTYQVDEAFKRGIIVFHFLGLIRGLYRAR